MLLEKLGVYLPKIETRFLSSNLQLSTQNEAKSSNRCVETLSHTATDKGLLNDGSSSVSYCILNTCGYMKSVMW